MESLEAWIQAVVEAPGLTALDLPAAREILLADALRGVPLLAGLEGPLVDVGSGNGSPGIPVAATLPRLEVVLLDAERRKCDFLETWAPANARVTWGRVEDQPTDWAGIALAKALAPPPVAAEWCLPLVRPGGTVVLWIGKSADTAGIAHVARLLAAEPIECPPGFAMLRKLGPTPPGFPRRTGVARKRPLA
ncbi:MAG TPA: RsmG family class I SAM-dependent methyltransferase [Gaiellaceae bacterium]